MSETDTQYEPTDLDDLRAAAARLSERGLDSEAVAVTAAVEEIIQQRIATSKTWRWQRAQEVIERNERDKVRGQEGQR